MQRILLCLKNKFYKRNQISKASTFSNFCSVLFWVSRSEFFLHFILINSTIYFCVVAKGFDFPLSEGFNLWINISTIRSTKLWLLNDFYNKNLKIIFISYVLFNILLWNSESSCTQTTCQNSISRPFKKWSSSYFQFDQEEKIPGHLFERGTYCCVLKTARVFSIPTGKEEYGW